MDAEPDLPFLKHAKAEYAGLQSATDAGQVLYSAA